MFFQKIAEMISHKPAKAVRLQVDAEIHAQLGNYQLSWKESSPGKLKFVYGNDGSEILVTPTWGTPRIEVRGENDPEFFRKFFRSVTKNTLSLD